MDVINIPALNIHAPNTIMDCQHYLQCCMISKINIKNDMGKNLVNKGKLDVGYRIVKIKTKNVTNKKFNDIKKYLIDSSKDMRVEYLVVSFCI